MEHHPRRTVSLLIFMNCCVHCRNSCWHFVTLITLARYVILCLLWWSLSETLELSYLVKPWHFCTLNLSKCSNLATFPPQNSSSVALLHKHLQLLLPHATDIYSRSANLLKESPWNGSVGEKLRGMFRTRFQILSVAIK